MEACRVVAQQHAGAGIQVQRAQVDVDLDLAVELEEAMRVDVAADFDFHHAKEVQLAVQGQGEDIANDAHMAGKFDLEQVQIGRADDGQVEVGLGRDGVAVQGGVRQRAGVDLQDRTALDLDDGNVELDLEAQVQRKVRVVVGVQAKGGRTGDGHFAEGPQVE